MSFTERQDRLSPCFDKRLLGSSFSQSVSFNAENPLVISNTLTKTILRNEDIHEVTKDNQSLDRPFLNKLFFYEMLHHSKKSIDKQTTECNIKQQDYYFESNE